MEPTRCISSHLMSNLLMWGTPQTTQNDYGRISSQNRLGFRRCCQEIVKGGTLPFLTAFASIETVVYTIFGVSSSFLLPVDDRPFLHFARLLESSKFTVIWSIANFIFPHVISLEKNCHESVAREMFKMEGAALGWELHSLNNGFCQWLGKELIHGSFNLGRQEDAAYLQHLNDVEKAKLNQDIDPVINEIIENISEELRGNFFSQAAFIAITTRVIYLYVAGSKKEEPLHLFKKETQEMIQDMREKLKKEANCERQSLLDEMTKPETLYKENNPNEENSSSTPIDHTKYPNSETTILQFFQPIRNAAWKELQQPYFVTIFWKRAAELMIK